MANAICVFDPNASSNPGKIAGTVTFHQCNPNTTTLVNFNLSGLKPGSTHGVHAHAAGDLSKGCVSACDHFNPYNTKHGSMELYGDSRHVGDLCNNIQADREGKVNFSYQDDLVQLYGEYTVIGRSVVIHADPDDLGRYRDEKSSRGKLSATTGNAGARIACAVIGVTDTDFHPDRHS